MRLLSRVFVIEFYNLKNVCNFYYKGRLTQNKQLYLKDNEFTQKDDNIYIKKLNNKDEWQKTLFFKDAYSDNNLFYDFLKKKYRV
tara:strand:- start:259 stop:513 length:255 start_codon:yes stop_codon:yes gene_type:complete